MSTPGRRVLLVGRGPLPAPTQRRTGFAQLRTAHFLQALRSAGHAVDLLLIEDDEEPGLLERGRHLAHAADVIVSAGPHRPAAVAVEICGERPTWIDLPGDPLAELQALCTAPGASVDRTRVSAAQAVAMAALARADALSVISTPQRHACLGELLAIGRGLRHPVPVAEIPIAFSLPSPQGPPRTPDPAGPVRVVLAGAVAPWLDDEGLAVALDQALARSPRLHVAFTGGGVPGHYEAGAERLRAWANATRFSARVAWHGWVEHALLDDILSQSHVGLCLDRPGAEPTLGSRTRVLLYAWSGLQIAASPTTALVRGLCDRDLATPLPAGDPDAVADQLVALVEAPPPPARVEAARAWLQARFDAQAITAPLLGFVAEPSRAPVGTPPAAQLAREVEALRGQLAAIHRSPTWRLLSRIHANLLRVAGR